MSSPNVETEYRFGEYRLLPAEQQLLRGNAEVPLTARAFAVLRMLVEHAGKLVSKDELLLRVWAGVVVEENNLAVQVGVLRKALGPTLIATIPGRGYRFTGVLIDASGDARPVAAQGRTESAPPAVAPMASLGNLPAAAPPLYGRADDLLALRALIDSHRLVTLVGAGGIGKTALAQALAHECLGLLDDGVWWVELAPLTDAALVASTVASVLRGTLGPDASIESFAKTLGASRMLIVLDNCEHLLQPVAEVAAALLRGAPNVRQVATSQEPLKVAQEQVCRLGPLALPDGVEIHFARQAGAVVLFEARARAADPRFALTQRNVADVIEICRRLDGIALAIELAAARVPLLGVAGLRARLDERFQVLSGGARLALQRHQTLRAALEWSHGLLTPEEQMVFRRLAVFVGSFGLESAQHVAAGTDLDVWVVLDRLGGLVDKSLVVAETGAEPRYRLLETTRAFALEKVADACETDSVRRRHAQALLAVFEGSHETEYTLSVQAQLERYLPDLDNARAALDWSASADGAAQLQIALAGAIIWIWFLAGLRPEGLRRTEAAMEAIGPSTPPHLEARLLAYWPKLAHPAVGDKELVGVARAIEIYRRLGDRRSLYAALCTQGKFAYSDSLDEADDLLIEAEQLIEADWPPAMRFQLLHARSNVSDKRGRYEEAIALLDEFGRLARALGDQRKILTALINSEQALAALGRLEESVARARELVRLLQEEPALRSGNEHFVLKNLLMSLARLGNVNEACDLARLARPAFDKLGGTWELLDPCALIAFKQGRLDDAARMLGRADRICADGNFQRDTVEQMLRESLLNGLAGALPAPEMSHLMKAGESLSDHEALLLAFG